MVPLPQPRNHPLLHTSTTIPAPNPSPINSRHYMNPNPFISALIHHPPPPNPHPLALHFPRPRRSRFFHNPPTSPLTSAEPHLIQHRHHSLAPVDKVSSPAFFSRPHYVNRPPPATRNISGSDTSDASDISACSNITTYGASTPYQALPPPSIVTVRDATSKKVPPLKDLPSRTRPGNLTTATVKPFSLVALASQGPSNSLYGLNQTYLGGHILDTLPTRMQTLNRPEDERQRAIRGSLTQPQPQPHSPTGPYIAPGILPQTQEPPRQLPAINDPYHGPVSPQTGAEDGGRALAPELAQTREDGASGQKTPVRLASAWRIHADEVDVVSEGMIWAENERVEMQGQWEAYQEINAKIYGALKKTPVVEPSTTSNLERETERAHTLEPPQRPANNGPVAVATQTDEIPFAVRQTYIKEDAGKYLSKLKQHIHAQLINCSAPAAPDLKRALAEDLITAGMQHSAASMFVTIIAAQAEAQAGVKAARTLAQVQKGDGEAVRKYAGGQIRENPEAWKAWGRTLRPAQNAGLNWTVHAADALKGRVEASKAKDLLLTLQGQLRALLAIAGDKEMPKLQGALAGELERAGMSASAAVTWVEEERLMARDEEERWEEGRRGEEGERKLEKAKKLAKWKVMRMEVMENMREIDIDGEEAAEKIQEAREIAKRYAERIMIKDKVEKENEEVREKAKNVRPYPDTPTVGQPPEQHEHRKRDENSKAMALEGKSWLRVDVVGETCSLDGQIYTFLNKARSAPIASPKTIEAESGMGEHKGIEKTNDSGASELNSRPPSPATLQDAETPKHVDYDPRRVLSCTGYPDCPLRFRSFLELARHIEDCPIENPPTDAEDDWAVIPGPSASPSPSSLNEDTQDGQTLYLPFECVGYLRCTRRFTRQEDLENHIDYAHGEDFAFPDNPGPLDEWTLLRSPSSSSLPPPSDPNTFNPLTSLRPGPTLTLLPFRPKPKPSTKAGPHLTLRGGCLSALLPPSWTTRLDDDAEVPAALWYFASGKPPKKGEKLPTGRQLREWKKKSKGEGWGEKGRGGAREIGYVVSQGKYFRDKKEKKGEGEKKGEEEEKDGEGGGDGTADTAAA